MRRSGPLVLAVLALALWPSAGAAARLGPYVALGDSYTSAPLVPMQHGTPIDCGRSDHNYPSLVAAALGPTRFTDVSCGSAVTADMTHPQTGLPAGGTNPPQFNALTRDAALVTIGIGGNDAGLVGVAEDCAKLDALSPFGARCRDKYTANGRDQVGERIEQARPKIDAVLEGIHARSPHARVAIAGYPHVAPPNGRSCYPLVPVSAEDLHYIDQLIIRINAMIREEAFRNDAEFVDTYADSGGHDVCTLPPTRWFEGIAPTEPAFPLHPNAKGEASMGRSALKVLGRAAPRPVLTALRTRRVRRVLRIRVRTDRPATVTLTLRRLRGKRPGRVVRRRTVAVPAARSVLIRLAVRRPGRYRLTAVPSTHAAAGRARRVTVRVRALRRRA